MRRIKLWRLRLLLFLAAVGPGFITANVDNDAGGIYTYSFAGAQFGYRLLWTMLPITVALIVIQEMCARMGAVTGKGLSDLIREEYGLRITFFMMLALVAANFGNVMAEFAGVASSMELFSVSKYVSVPIAAVLVWILVVKGTYKLIEKVFLLASLFYIAYMVAAVLAHPDWTQAAISTVKPPSLSELLNVNYLYMVIGMIGATIAPWMQFYLQASVVEKGVTHKQMTGTRIDVITGGIFATLVAASIVIACAATIYMTGHRNIHFAAEAAVALRPVAGDFAAILFGVGLLNASLFAASILPLSTAYTVCEGLGLESGLNKKFSEAPFFYWLYTLLIAAGAGVILMPNFPLLKITVLSQVINGVLLPFVLIFMMLLANKRELMSGYVNSRFYNIVAGVTAGVLILLSAAWMYLSD